MTKRAHVTGGTTKALGLMIKVARICHSHSAREMSRLAAIPVSSYRRLKDPQPTPEELLRIAAVLGMPLSRMISIIDDAGMLPDPLDASACAKFVQTAVDFAGRDEDILNHHVIQRFILDPPTE